MTDFDLSVQCLHGGAEGLGDLCVGLVRMRPQPNASEKSYALKHTLTKGAKLRYLGRNDAKLPLNQDWVQVVSPADAHAWVSAADTTALAANEDGKALFVAAESDARTKALLVVTLFDRRTGKRRRKSIRSGFSSPKG